jgi:CHAD domain-containing protein
MPFRFKRKEPVAHAVRRIYGKVSNDALESLNDTSHFEAVHGVRKEIKKLRSLLRLVRHDIGKEAYGKYTDTLRDAANHLRAMRDAQVTLGTFESLEKDFDGKVPTLRFPKIRSALRSHCRAEGKKLEDSAAPVKTLLRESQQQFKNLKVKPKGWKAIKPGLEKAYGQGRNAFAAVEREPSPENFHEWRKRVKDLYHQLSLLCPVCPHKLRRRIKRLDKLGGLLGDDHDLAMLKEFVAGKLGHTPNAQAFEKVIASRQEKLRSKALKLGAQFYPKKPHRFSRKVGNYWKSWRGKK